MSTTHSHRIDPPAKPVPLAPLGADRTADRQVEICSGSPLDSALLRIDQPGSTEMRGNRAESNVETSDVLLNLHAIDLVDRLQSWAADLDAREAQLNSRTSLQDHRERQFRLAQQDAETELAEQQRAIERLRREVEAQARRIAFQS